MSYNIANLCKEEINKLLESGILEVCPHCGQIFAVSDGVEVGGELCCPDCGNQGKRSITTRPQKIGNLIRGSR